MRKYVVVPVFKRLNHTINFVNSVSAEISNITFVIVDDSPERENYNYFKDYPNIITLLTSGDEWWCGTMRAGLNYIESLELHDDDIIILANNDVLLPLNTWRKIESNIRSDLIVHPRTITTDGVEVSSGCIVKSWFPYITIHPKGILIDTDIDLCTGRFLCMNISTYKKVGNISKNLVQYHGDYDFGLRARKNGVRVVLLHDSNCILYDKDTGIKSYNVNSLTDFLNSFKSIKSPNNIKSKYDFLSNHFSKPYAVLITFSMVFNSILRFFSMKLKSYL
ncbi:hypothetical protein WAX88_09045 [Photobacterium damselae subsp. damselae]|uniref:glycosyltransferase family 2 protein n=1 Tax=Photobacterium damselae TaxID=38293 RepID=UPI00311AEE36